MTYPPHGFPSIGDVIPEQSSSRGDRELHSVCFLIHLDVIHDGALETKVRTSGVYERSAHICNNTTATNEHQHQPLHSVGF